MIDFRFSSHALERIRHRGIDAEIVIRILQDPPQVIVIQDGLAIYQSIVEEKSKVYLYRIFVNTAVKPATVVTVYKTSQISKYYEGEI